MALQVSEANLAGILPNATIAVFGKRRTGKTTMLKYKICPVLKHSLGLNRFIVVAGNKDCVREWNQIIPSSMVRIKDLDYIRGIVAYQEKKAEFYSPAPLPRKYQMVMIIDDCADDKKFMTSPVLRDLFSNGRHYGITLVLNLQYFNQMTTDNRAQLDYILVLHTNNTADFKKIQSEFIPSLTIRQTRDVISACTANRGGCWIDNTNAGPSPVHHAPDHHHDSSDHRLGGGGDVPNGPMNVFYVAPVEDADSVIEPLCADYLLKYAKNHSNPKNTGGVHSGENSTSMEKRHDSNTNSRETIVETEDDDGFMFDFPTPCGPVRLRPSNSTRMNQNHR